MMFSFWSEGPRTWKWVVPAGAALFLALPIYRFWLSNNDMQRLTALVFVGIACLLMIAAFTNWWKLTTQHLADLNRDRAEALSVTPTVLLAKYMQSMHPEAVRVLDKFGVRTLWGVNFNSEMTDRDWVLGDTSPAVHFGFIEYVLSKSGKTLYPKNRFAEGAKKWDPDGIALDRDQYDELYKWGLARLIWTRSMGEYRPAEFIPPWTPERLIQAMGMSGEQDLYYPEEVSAVKELPRESAKRESVEREAKAVPVSEMSAEEQEANRVEMESYAMKFVDGKVPS